MDRAHWRPLPRHSASSTPHASHQYTVLRGRATKRFSAYLNVLKPSEPRPSPRYREPVAWPYEDALDILGALANPTALISTHPFGAAVDHQRLTAGIHEVSFDHLAEVVRHLFSNAVIAYDRIGLASGNVRICAVAACGETSEERIDYRFCARRAETERSAHPSDLKSNR